MLTLNQNVTKLNLTLTQSGVSIQVQPVITVESNTVNTGSDKNFVFVQNNPSASWVINHQLNKYPSIDIVDTSKNKVLGEVVYSSLNQIIINFSAPFSGEAYLN